MKTSHAKFDQFLILKPLMRTSANLCMVLAGNAEVCNEICFSFLRSSHSILRFDSLGETVMRTNVDYLQIPATLIFTKI